MAAARASVDVGVVTISCGYCGSMLKNVGIRAAHRHVVSCSKERTPNAAQVGQLFAMQAVYS